MKTSRRLLVLAVPGVAILLLSSGCTSTSLARVHPWERTALVDYSMNPGRDPLALAAAEHVYFSRESASGGRGVNGSSCGCN